tara:strand:- start:16000 stop:16899 length:900 start_codon:yes stop_codon:yes gene_type:complete
VKLAIVIPFYKIEYFNDTLKSLALQTDKRFRVYIGDDGSPINPEHLLQKYDGQFNYTYHRFEANLGGISLSKHWKRCIDLTQGEPWIMILGDDDWLRENIVQSFYENIDKIWGTYNLVRFASTIQYQKEGRFSKKFEHPSIENKEDAFFRKFMHITRSSLSEYIFSRKSYDRHGFKDYPLAWNSDDWAWLNFAENKPIYTINDAEVFVRISDRNISGKEDNKKEKLMSEIQFYSDIIIAKKMKLRLDIYIEILRRYELLLSKNYMLTKKILFKLGVLYLKNGGVFELKKFLSRIKETYR